MPSSKPHGPTALGRWTSPVVRERVDWGRAGRLASDLGVRDKFEVFYRLVYEAVVRYVGTGDSAFLEKAAREALRSGAFLEHVLDLILVTPPEALPPSARRLAGGVRYIIARADCGLLSRRLLVPCEIAKRRLDLIKVGEEEVGELLALGVERVVYAFCKAAGVIIQ